MNQRAFGWLLAAVAALFTCSATGAGPGCDPDLDISGNVGVNDLLLMLANWGPCPLAPDGPCIADVNGDDMVDLLDLAILLECWGPCPCRLPVIGEIFDATVVVDVTDAGAAAEGLLVTQLYATGAAVTVGDALLLVQAELVPNAITTFYQDLFDADIPPSSFFCPAFPTSCYDSFVTMREVVEDDSPLVLAPGFLLTTAGLNGSWLATPEQPDREAVDISGITGNPGQAGVLIAQITLTQPSAEGPSSVGYAGNVRMWAAGAGGQDGAESKMAFLDCPWDCELNPDGDVGINDFLEVLAQWPLPEGTSCDFDGGSVGITDFLELLAHWGPCPG